MNILENVSNNYCIDKDYVISCSSREDNRDGAVHFLFKFSSNIVIRMSLDQDFLKKYSSGDRLQVILGKLNEKYYEAKQAFVQDPNIDFLEKSRNILTSERDLSIPKPYVTELQQTYDYGIERQSKKIRKRVEKANQMWDTMAGEPSNKEETQDEIISRFQDILEED